MPGDGRATAIFKQPVSGRVRVGWEGLESDVQADRRFHGGVEKALHHFPLEKIDDAIATAKKAEAGKIIVTPR